MDKIPAGTLFKVLPEEGRQIGLSGKTCDYPFVAIGDYRNKAIIAENKGDDKKYFVLKSMCKIIPSELSEWV